MSLTKLFLAPIKLFRKQVITFLKIRRYDLGIVNENLNYIAVKTTASISVLRHKVWFLLNLPDYCEEIIILKSANDVEIPLTELRRGNDPQRPYILEVWSPKSQDMGIHKSKLSLDSATVNMIAYKNEDRSSANWSTSSIIEKEELAEKSTFISTIKENQPISKETILLNSPSSNATEWKKSELSCKLSRSSIFRSNGKKSQDNMTNLLLKIQGDLSTLSNKLTTLENKMSLS